IADGNRQDTDLNHGNPHPGTYFTPQGDPRHNLPPTPQQQEPAQQPPVQQPVVQQPTQQQPMQPLAQRQRPAAQTPPPARTMPPAGRRVGAANELQGGGPNLQDMLTTMAAAGASDPHLTVRSPPMVARRRAPGALEGYPMLGCD